MRFQALFFFSACFTAVIPSQFDLSSSPTDLFNDDSQLFAFEPQSEAADTTDQLFGTNSNFFLDDDQFLSPTEMDPTATDLTETDPTFVLAGTDWNQIAEPDPDFLLADNAACDSSDAGSLQLFAKFRRRGDACKGEDVGRPPSIDDGKEPLEPDLGFTNFVINQRMNSVFPKDDGRCPYAKYSVSNILVCKEYNPNDMSQIPGNDWYNLRDVLPGMFD